MNKIVKYGDIVVKFDGDMVLITKNGGDGTVLRYTRDEWDTFIAGAKDGEFHFNDKIGDGDDQPSFTFIEDDK